MARKYYMAAASRLAAGWVLLAACGPTSPVEDAAVDAGDLAATARDLSVHDGPLGRLDFAIIADAAPDQRDANLLDLRGDDAADAAPSEGGVDAAMDLAEGARDLRTMDAGPDLAPSPDLRPPYDLVFNADSLPTPPGSCGDQKKSNRETDIDCGGGGCPRCPDGKGCQKPEDCLTKVCMNNKCVGGKTPQLVFVKGGSFPNGSKPNTVVTGDFNGDGKLDVLVASSQGADLHMHLGNGDGTLQKALLVGKLDLTYGGVAHDFNGDKKLDAAFTEYDSGLLRVFLGNGDGTLKPAADYGPLSDAKQKLQHLAMGDFNGDGVMDLAAGAASPARVFVLRGWQDGTFSVNSVTSAGKSLIALSVADWNRDSTPDVLVGSVEFGVMYGLGKGLLSDLSILGPTGAAFEIITADLNGDSSADVVVLSSQAPDRLYRFLRHPLGALSPRVEFATGRDALCLIVDDFNLDGVPDAATCSFLDGSISFLDGTGDGSFRASALLLGVPWANAMAAGRFNADELLDIVVLGESPDVVTMLINQSR